MSTAFFKRDATDAAKNNVRALFDAMTPDFRTHLMRTFMWSPDKLEAYLSRNAELKGDALRDAYNHLDSLLSRIETFASEHSKTAFPSYDEWVDQEYKKYKKEHRQDVEAIQELMNEGGVVAPGNTSPVDTMENDSESHYNHLKSEFDRVQARSSEAVKLTKSNPYQALLTTAQEMNKLIASC